MVAMDIGVVLAGIPYVISQGRCENSSTQVFHRG